MTSQEYAERVAKARKYYSQFDPEEPKITDWRKWLETLSEPMKSDIYNEGFAYSKTTLLFQAFYLSEIKEVIQ